MAEGQGEIPRVCGANLKNSNGGKRFVRGVDGVHNLADDLMLARFGGDQNGIHLRERLDHRRRTSERCNGEFIPEQFSEHLDHFGRIRMLERNETNVGRPHLS